MSNRFQACGPSARSPTHSAGTICPEPPRDGVDNRRTNATTRYAAANDQRVDARPDEEGQKRCAEESRRGSLLPHRLRGERPDTLVNPAPTGALNQLFQSRHLPQPGFPLQRRGLKCNGRKRDRDSLLARGADELHRGRDDLGQVAADRTGGIGEAVLEVNDDDGRFPPGAGARTDPTSAIDLRSRAKSTRRRNLPIFLEPRQYAQLPCGSRPGTPYIIFERLEG